MKLKFWLKKNGWILLSVLVFLIIIYGVYTHRNDKLTEDTEYRITQPIPPVIFID